jgi:hypothetical protein
MVLYYLHVNSFSFENYLHHYDISMLYVNIYHMKTQAGIYIYNEQYDFVVFSCV